MAKIRRVYDDTLKPDGSRLTIYPITSTRAVYTPGSVQLEAMLNVGYRFGGIVEPNDAVPFTNQRAWFLGTTAGCYTNFGNYELPEGYAGAFYWDGTEWHMETFALGGGGVATETDPVFSASAAANINLSDISTWNGKQDALVSGTNIKTINGVSILGSGNIPISGGGTQVQSDWNQSDSSAVDFIKNKPTIPSAYTLPVATSSVLGGVKQGSGVSIAADGTISATGGGSIANWVKCTSAEYAAAQQGGTLQQDVLYIIVDTNASS